MRATQAFIEQTGGPEVIQWREVDLPAPGPHEVLIRHEAVGLNFIHQLSLGSLEAKGILVHYFELMILYQHLVRLFGFQKSQLYGIRFLFDPKPFYVLHLIILKTLHLGSRIQPKYF